MTKTIRCTDCSAEFAEEEVAGVSGCPTCGTRGVPCAISEDVTLRINWHELRILGIWASNWAEAKCGDQEKRTIAAILHRLHAQYPDKGPLTLMGEFRELASGLNTDVEVIQGGTRTVIKPPVKS